MSTAAAPPAWRVHLPTADVTCVRLQMPRREDADPWPLSAAVHELLALGAARADRPHAVGAGRGIPILHTQQLRSGALNVELCSQHLRSGDDEVSLTLPSWDELIDLVPAEDAVWELVDVVAASCAARYGTIGDGEALGDSGGWIDGATRGLERHIGLLVDAAALDGVAGARYCELERSGLTVVLR